MEEVISLVLYMFNLRRLRHLQRARRPVATESEGLELRIVWAREIWESHLKANGVVRSQGIRGERQKPRTGETDI